MPSILPSSGDHDVLGLNWLKRFVNGSRPCPSPENPDCRRRLEDQQRREEAEFRRREHEYLSSMEDEIAVIARERNGH